jgi:adenosylcobyric acid synthase
MLQGTGSDVGKSLLVAGLCRAYTRRGMKVRPFKPQNMSNNAAVTVGGGEIGRAQALQARACGVAPCVDMNPVLLKPQSDVGSQIVVQGKMWRNAHASEYYKLKATLLPSVIESFDRLSSEADLVLVEGAGSAAEINLREGDIANMGFAQVRQVPVAIIGDIDRGGVIASIVGTMGLLSDADRRLIAGYIINRFRGDIRLFDTGIDAITQHTQLSCFGVVPFFAEAGRLPAEDSVSLDQRHVSAPGAQLKIAVPVLSRISNFDDLDPLIAEPDVDVQFVQHGEALPGDADLVVLPGSKATIGDLHFLRQQGWDIDIAGHLRRGGWLLGLCGGFQMLGNCVRDPTGIEGEPNDAPGLSLLDMETVLDTSKRLVECTGVDRRSGEAVAGYEMHKGHTSGEALDSPMLDLDGKPDGAISADGKTMGCYLHGLFAKDAFRHAYLNAIRHRESSGLAYERRIDDTLDALALHVETHLNLDAIAEIACARGSPKRTTIVPASPAQQAHQQ